MKILIMLLILITLLWCCSVPLIIRGYVRVIADSMISGNRTANEERLDSCISALAWFNQWPFCDIKIDNLRIEQLREMLKEMQKPHIGID